MSAKRGTQRGPIRIVPLRRPSGVAAPAPAPARAPTAALTYRGGSVLAAVQPVAVFWGTAWRDAAQQNTLQALNSFLQFVVASPYLDQLAEYSTPKQAIGRGRFGGTAVVTDSAPGTSLPDSAIQQMLDQQVSSKAFPAATPNTVYFVFLPPGVTVVAGSDRSCQAFCGYHERSSAGLYYAVVPYPNCTGCLADLSAIDALTSVCSHELAEAITDPVPGQGWYDDANGEIGDVCAWQNKTLGDYTVQLLWSNRAKACV